MFSYVPTCRGTWRDVQCPMRMWRCTAMTIDEADRYSVMRVNHHSCIHSMTRLTSAALDCVGQTDLFTCLCVVGAVFIHSPSLLGLEWLVGV